jgi:hypothetical protein
MTLFFKPLLDFFKKKQPLAVGNSLPNSDIFQPSKLLDSSDTATRGQLVQVMMRDLVRKSGIPPGWVQCQIQVINSRSRGQGIYVRLIVKHWDERLMKYAFAFQKALLTEIVQFEPEASKWLQGISWQLEVAATCPVTELPGKQFWHDAKAVDPFEIIPMPAPANLPVPQPAQAAPALPVVPAVPVIPVLPVVAAASAVPLLDALDSLPSLPSLPNQAITPENDTAEDLEKLFAIRDKELEHQAVNKLLPMGYEKTEPVPL